MARVGSVDVGLPLLVVLELDPRWSGPSWPRHSRLPGVWPTCDQRLDEPGGWPIASRTVLLPERGVLFTGDSIASADSAPILGPFNLNTADAVAAVRKQAQLDFEIACIGHGRPIVGKASRKVLAMIRSL